MRSWVWGGCLAALTGSGVYLVFAGATGVSHCGPCVACSTATADSSVGVCPADGVTEVVDVPAVLARPRVPATPFVSFDEPPLASPPRDGLTPVMLQPVSSGVVTVGYIEPATDGLEMAPRPRKVAAPGEIPLASPTDPY